VLTYGGGTLAITSPHKILLERIDPASPRGQRTVEERALDAQGLASSVRDGDILTLFKISPQFANAVTLRGNVAAPLRYPFRPGMKISDLIPEREALIRPEYYQSRNMMVQFESGTRITDSRLTNEVRNQLEEVNWDYALIERLDAKAVRSQLIPFNLGRAVLEHDPRDDLALMPGDVVTIFSVTDVPVPIEKRNQFVKLGGEVKASGLYQITPGERLPQLVQRAGGLTSNAFVYGTEFLRESTRKQQQANLDLAVRSFEADAAGFSATIMQNSTDAEKASSAQAQIASQQMIVSRLKSLRASGRIALDMDPVRPVLPDIVLEDGDTIIVPYPPSFVGVFGAVLAERSFLYRDTFVVGDYVKRAGLTRNAEEDALMVIRADGTVESDSQRANALFSFSPGLLGRKVYPGDSIFIPEKLDRETAYSRFIRGARDWTAIFYQFGLGAAGIKILRQ
jgi:protein involved in polysaccharide export with SLBB domain